MTISEPFRLSDDVFLASCSSLAPDLVNLIYFRGKMISMYHEKEHSVNAHIGYLCIPKHEKRNMYAYM